MSAVEDYHRLLEERPSEVLKLVDTNFLRDLLSDFTLATGLTANIVATDGKSIFSKKDAQNNCEFCKIVRSLEGKKGMHRCVDSYERMGKQAVKYQEAIFFRCPAGLVEWITPIMLEDTHIGSIICGQVLMWKPDEFFWVELERFNKELTDDIEPLKAAADKLQIVSASKAQAACKILGILANSIVKTIWEEMRRKSEAEYQQKLLEQERDTRRELERQLNVYSASYSYDQIKGFSNAVKNHDIEKARSIMKVIIADTINRDADLGYVQTQLYDIMFSLSHVAMENGVSSDECMRIMAQYCTTEHYSESLEELGSRAIETGEQLVAAIERGSGSHRPAVDAMCGYIKTHMNVSFSLQDVADAVELSPYYASRIFKEDMGMSVMDYATAIRMDEAKYLLSNPNYRIGEIAAKLGYADASYFGRVFKKTVGMSPRQYRNTH